MAFTDVFVDRSPRYVSMTVIAQDPHLIGRMAAERLLARIAGDTGPVQQIVVPTSFLVRGSGEIPPP